MLNELVKLALKTNYKAFEISFDINNFNLDDKVEISYLDLLENESIRNIILKKIIESRNVSFEKRKELFEKLVELKADVNFKDKYGKTLLHACQDNAESAKLLIDHGANIHARDVNKQTPLHWCINEVVAKLLIDSGADVNVRDKYGHTPLHNCWNAEITQLLLDLKADVNAKDELGNIPLHNCMSEDIETVKVLIKAKADLYAVNEYDESFINMFYRFASYELLKFLLEEKILFELVSPYMIWCELFKEYTESFIEYIVNYDNDKLVENIVKMMF